MHPLHQFSTGSPLCVCFEIVPDNPFGVLILYYPLSSAKRPIFICLTFLLHTNLVLSFPFCFDKFSTVLSLFGVNGNGWRKPQNLGRRLCPFSIRFVVIGQWDRALTSSSPEKLLGQSWPNLVCSISRIRRQKIVNFITPHSKGSLFWGKTRKINVFVEKKNFFCTPKDVSNKYIAVMTKDGST